MAYDDLGNRPPGTVDPEPGRGGNTGLIIALAVVAVIAIAWFGFGGRGTHDTGSEGEGAAMHEPVGDEGGEPARPAPRGGDVEPSGR
jgi:hypothetical protein